MDEFMGSKPLKLYVKVDKNYQQVDSFLLDKFAKPITKIAIDKAIDKYVKICTANKCEKNQNSEKLYFRKLQAFFEQQNLLNISDVTAEHMDRFESLLLKSMKVSSVNRRFNTLRHFFGKCVEWEFIHKSPCAALKKKREEDNPRKPWDRQTFDRFIKTCAGVYSDLFRFLWLTGCRPMEAKNLRWTDVDYDQGTIKLRCGKNAKIVRFFPLTKELDILLHNIKINSVYVFANGTTQINNDNLYHYCKKRMKKLKIIGLTVYGIRHGFGTRLAQQNVSAFYIAELMGHTDLETTKQYVHAEKKHLHQILNKAK